MRCILGELAGFEVLDEAVNEQEMLEKSGHLQPDLVIMDYNQDGKFSHDSITKLKSVSPATQLLIISGDDNKQTIYKVLESGVSGFLTKQCEQHEIQDAVKASAKGEKFYCTNVLNHLLEKSFPKEQDCAPTVLSSREIDILRLAAKGLIAKEIADRLNLSTHTVYTHRKNIMRKLQLGTSSEMVLYAVSQGFV